ncbi:MAG TPA: antitoxin [Mycobacterium sp.]|nr:antitoxin [Mycobacterium sp.]
MRTTINLPDDLHRRVVSLAKDTNATLSQAFVDLVRRGLGEQSATLAITVDEQTGLPQVTLGTVITTDDVRRALDEE